MAELSEFKVLLAEICEEWSKAEADTKAAEQVCEEVIYPSIMELRYAGRRLAQALEVISSGGDARRAHDLLQDAWFNCHRARHDAIDAATSQISITINSAVKNLRHSAVIAAFPDFVHLVTSIQNIRGEIKKSRASQDDRDALYEVIEKSDFPQLLAWFAQFQASESVMIEVAKDTRRERVIARCALVVAVVAALLASAAFIYEITKDHSRPTFMSAPTSQPAIHPSATQGMAPQPPK